MTPFYDPMIAKLIATGVDREQARARLEQALRAYVVRGIQTNIPMLLDVITHDVFKSGVTTTKFVEEHYLPTVTK